MNRSRNSKLAEVEMGRSGVRPANDSFSALNMDNLPEPALQPLGNAVRLLQTNYGPKEDAAEAMMSSRLTLIQQLVVVIIMFG